MISSGGGRAKNMTIDENRSRKIFALFKRFLGGFLKISVHIFWVVMIIDEVGGGSGRFFDEIIYGRSLSFE